MRIEIPDEKRLVHEMRIPIRWGDMDAMGHVNNVSYFRYLETARIEWLNGAGFQPDPGGEGFVIINAFCNFLIQLEYPGEIVAKTYAANLGRSSFDSFTTLERADQPGVISAAGGATIVWVNFPQQKSMPFPSRLRELIA
ncbi:MAG TPA: thioesterase family protein [Rhizobacter sp.]|nr:thioesterase family protein [Rhizobacter sp.]